MAAEKIFTDDEHWQNQETIIGPIDRNRKREFGTYSYKPEYCNIVYRLLSESITAKTKSHCCRALHCSKPTLLRWMDKFPEFKEAVEAGLEIGKSRWRDRIAENAFEPSAKVNNGLIKMLSANVYGIKDEPTLIINNNNTIGDPEEIMKQRGIPIPSLDIDDITSPDMETDCIDKSEEEIVDGDG